jgi:AraC-like DNA-binding protein
MSRRAPSLAQAEASIRHYAGEYAAHVHGHAQVLVGLRGRLELEVDGRPAYVDASSALVVPPGASHGYLAGRPAAVLVIDAPLTAGLDRFRRFLPPLAWKDPRRPFDADAAVREVAASATALVRRRLDLAAIDVALDRELHGAWTTPRLAAVCMLSPQRFHARFVELTGVTPGGYVRRRRLDEAQRLIRQGFSLEAAALQVGYASASALGHALRRDRGSGVRSTRAAG